MNIPTRHLSVRVPWHDAEWNGKVCCNPRENGSCMFLPRVHSNKNVEVEETNTEKWLHELPHDQLPPCVGEKVSFMSEHSIYKKVSHPYSNNKQNDKFYGHYKETTLCYPGYSFSVVPYNWMLKNPKENSSEKAKEFELNYDPEKEPKLEFENAWVQQASNQKLLLDTFINPIVANTSLVFIYAKNIPFVDNTSRILIGVGRVSKIGALTEYEYENALPTSFRSTLWERPVYHSIRPGYTDGFLLPYHEFFKQIGKDSDIDIQEYIAFAPSFEEFSYGSEWVSNDSAIESLLILSEKLKKFEIILPEKNYEVQLKWIDNEVSRLWKMRGPFPGLGAVLSGMNIIEGNRIAWELDKVIRDKQTDEVIENPWSYVVRLYKDDRSFLPKDFKVNVDNTLKATWDNYSSEEKEFLELLSRMNLNNEQVQAVINRKEKEQITLLKNPYLLYENSRLDILNFPVATIDKAIFADKKILERFPLPQSIDITMPLDQRRIRALMVQILEQNALEGNTLLTDNQIVTKLDEQPIQPLCNPSTRNIAAINEFLSSEVLRLILDEEQELYYYKLKRYELIKDKIKKFVQKRIKRQIDPPVELDWMGITNKVFGEVDTTMPVWHQEKDKAARKEKAEALNVLSNSRVSILIGPAGTGKTTLLNILCNLPAISSGTILQLAPTGKARVNMGKDAMTLAQFLIKVKRYDPETGRYSINPNAPPVKYDTVILDESSMLTEDQLASLIDSLTGVERFILVGDYRQLPPIGAGRPFVDIMEFLKQEKKGITELKEIFRQEAKVEISEENAERLDIRLSKWFSDDTIKKEQVDIFKEISEHGKKEWENIKFVEWHNVKHLEEILIKVTNEEIEKLLSADSTKTTRNPMANFDLSLGSNYYIEKANWSAFAIESAEQIENWQILSPMRTAGYGTKVLNKQIQKEYRGKTKEKAIFPGTYKDWKTKEERYNPRKMPKPVGDDGIVYGDKIINTKNTRWNMPWNKVFNPDQIPEDEILKYMANGEIGIHVGFYGEWKHVGPRPVNVAFSSQPGYSYSFKESDFKEDGNVQMELAYSITVHKSQGSGFKVVLFILPNPCPILSRELFYTALTRQKDRIVILHQGNFKDFQKYTTGEYSETGRRLTDLFSEPTLKFVNKKFYDSKYIQISSKGEFMISKSEVIIADQLHLKNIPYLYEAPVSDESGITVHPDFTIVDSDSDITYYWEHLGMLTKDDYRSKWKRKEEWYEKKGIVEYSKNPNAKEQLIITRDKPDGGIDASEIKEIIDELFA
jgi:hypothetical protein